MGRKSNKQIQQEQHQLIVSYIEAIVFIAIGLIALLTKGILGRTLCKTVMFFVGRFYFVVFIALILLGLFLIIKLSIPQFSTKMIIGVIVGVCSILLLLSFPKDHAVGTKAFSDYWNEIKLLFQQDNINPKGGIIGAILYFISSSLADYIGSWIIVILLFILAAILMIDREYFAHFGITIGKVSKKVTTKTREVIQEAKANHQQRIINMSNEVEPSPQEPTIDIIRDGQHVGEITESEIQEVFSHDHRGIITLGEDPEEEPYDPDYDDSIDDYEDMDQPYEPEEEPILAVEVEPKEKKARVVHSPKPQMEQTTMNFPEEPEEEEDDSEEDLESNRKYIDYANFETALPNHIRLLKKNDAQQSIIRRNRDVANVKGERLIEVLSQFSINAKLENTYIGPSVTKFVIRPDENINVNKIVNIQDNIKMELAARTIRIEAPIPGVRGVGVEIPNEENTVVRMRELFEVLPEKYAQKPLTVALGKDLFGAPVYCDLDKMPHLLVAGATGSGKSVCMNAIITSLIMRNSPADVKLLLIDPKKVEFSEYKDVPHLIGPVISDPSKAAKILKVVVDIMNSRYEKFSKAGVKNIDGYNRYVEQSHQKGLRKEPYVVVIIDELADLMVVAGKEVEQYIQRITQLARAAGIHLIVATQRPSTDVITGVIKANIPSRISFAVTNGIDSKVILDQTGAENLLGNGDMLYKPQGVTTKRVQGVFVTDEEVHNVCTFVKRQAKPFYIDEIYNALTSIEDSAGNGFDDDSSDDPMYSEVLKYVVKEQKCSTSLLQRKFGLGYNRAARIVDRMEEKGIVGPANGSKPREVFIKSIDEANVE